ncbi:hypothetical protein FY034_18990 (plasmid) [Trichlorobacter lovleyi]|uniref:hypothetical protein n=1 Tax=Trichlorobacter lovleyi TaxID=313985 RepID=UPI0022403406|nr:hypothetical protein [Trichlorobacter lovleyi]QOX81064.1 hypothetical protein FY034_18990 [Trichlorobacter lovleyi]
MKSPYFDIIPGSDGRYRIALAEKYARKFAQAVGGIFISPALPTKEDAERIAWKFISEASAMGLKEMRRRHSDIVADRAFAASAQESLF